jgi:uncharacterized RDD family membrane protein YckC
MSDPYRLATPEQVDLEYDLAGLGSRFVAALIDSTIQAVLWLALTFGVIGGGALFAAIIRDILVTESGTSVIGVAATVLFILLNFLLLWGYYPFFEVIWSGQTPGKRIMGLRVVKSDGSPIGFLEALIRNVVRIADFLPFAYIIGVAVMLFNKRARRLGDFAAGTIVVKERRDLTLASLSEASASRIAGVEAEKPEQLLNWSTLSPEDYVLAREFLLRRTALSPVRRERLGERIARGLAEKMGERAPEQEQAEAFLERIAAEYRRR